MSLYKKATPPILDDYSNAEEFHNPLFTENEVQYDEVDEENEPYSTLSNHSEGELYPYPLSTDNQDEVIYDEVGHEVDYDEVDYDEVEEVIEQYDTVDEQEATDHYKADEEIIYRRKERWTSKW